MKFNIDEFIEKGFVMETPFETINSRIEALQEQGLSDDEIIEKLNGRKLIDAQSFQPYLLIEGHRFYLQRREVVTEPEIQVPTKKRVRKKRTVKS